MPARCAGLCELTRDHVTNKYERIRIKLSTPLLQYRSRLDTINTLLHEAIHAYFFITTSWTHSRGDDGTGHGAGFQLLAAQINIHGNYDITIHHTFHDEVDSYRTHVWQCQGPCRQLPPHFGLVKRSMNRPPGKSDPWWAIHDADCGGSYTKIQEPALTKKQRDAMSKKDRAGLQKNKLDSWVKQAQRTGAGAKAAENDQSPAEHVIQLHGHSNKRKVEVAAMDSAVHDSVQKRNRSGTKERYADSNAVVLDMRVLIKCPICSQSLAQNDINKHLDALHPP